MSEEKVYTYETVKKIVKIEEKHLISEFLEKIHNCRGMDFKQLINYLVRVEQEYEERVK